ncbi:hypothetical protein DYP60_12565 [Sphaerochaeta halotolerans]|uniref:Uncharacterized protein n=1 Tax=Sphaerochaeta halotolerans TaxID=2293840 RepID=A0A372MFB0_9SPIR|nr:hypothetical protein [Sphaerochaeta halotolerans]RFU93890.1 hypothetical protein DYP60_12565 [Sphaerochaeta halotolerans]
METIADFDRARDALMKLDRSILVDALLKLAIESSSASMMVEGLISSLDERIALFRENIHRITHQGHRSTLSGEQILDILTRSLELLDPDQIDPALGLELMELFYSTDEWALNSTNELDFEFELLYTDDGYSKFTEFAERCDDPILVQQVVNRLLASDDYGMRENLSEVVS